MEKGPRKYKTYTRRKMWSQRGGFYGGDLGVCGDCQIIRVSEGLEDHLKKYTELFLKKKNRQH